jgi:hypothetical protein
MNLPHCVKAHTVLGIYPPSNQILTPHSIILLPIQTIPQNFTHPHFVRAPTISGKDTPISTIPQNSIIPILKQWNLPPFREGSHVIGNYPTYQPNHNTSINHITSNTNHTTKLHSSPFRESCHNIGKGFQPYHNIFTHSHTQTHESTKICEGTHSIGLG